MTSVTGRGFLVLLAAAKGAFAGARGLPGLVQERGIPTAYELLRFTDGRGTRDTTYQKTAHRADPVFWNPANIFEIQAAFHRQG